MQINSIVVVKWAKGWVAYITRDDPRRSKIMSHFNKDALFADIEKEISREL